MTTPPQPTHFDERGEVRMVDVGAKEVSAREAVAEGWISMQPRTLDMIRRGEQQKGDVLAVARVAGIMAAKRTADIVPLCHPLMLTHIAVTLQPEAPPEGEPRVRCTATAATRERTGVEMEAMAAVQAALLTVYDMCKGMDRAMVIREVRLLRKSGGASGDWPPRPPA